MKTHVVYRVECPGCGEKSWIRLADAFRFWLPRAAWRCPHCHKRFSTEELQEYDPREGKTDG